MSVKIRPYRKGGWEVDIMIRFDNGEKLRERRKAPVSAKSAAKRWAQKRELFLLAEGPPSLKLAREAVAAVERQAEEKTEEVPTFAEFVQRYLEGYVSANRHKPSTIASTNKNLRVHILPAFGEKKLDELKQEDVQRFMGSRTHLKPKTVNNALSVLNTMLKTAVEWGLIKALPVRIRLLKVTKPTMEFFDFDEVEHMLERADQMDARYTLLILLGAEAGLRAGEMRALEWTALDFRRKLLTVDKAEWGGHVTTPKHGKTRVIPMTDRLSMALKAHRHLRGPLVLYRDSGKAMSPQSQREWLHKVLRQANLKLRSPHALRHTFCSHLAMRGAPAKAIQELAGHASLSTTERYMHLSPAALAGAIRLLQQPSPTYAAAEDRLGGDQEESGDMLETARRRRR